MKRLLLAGMFTMIATGAFAQTCVVNDPTGTPLNVRARPNGAILGALHNGAAVQVLQVIYDSGGRPWAYIAPLDAGRRGWVFGNFLTCGR
jgi:Bacterial SH3 domain